MSFDFSISHEGTVKIFFSVKIVERIVEYGRSSVNYVYVYTSNVGLLRIVNALILYRVGG